MALAHAECHHQLLRRMVMPRKKIAYREVTLEEMDTEAILARHLQVVLVDGLAHTNILGSNEPEGYLAWSSRLIGFLKYGKNASRQQERALRRLEEHAVFAEDSGRGSHSNERS